MLALQYIFSTQIVALPASRSRWPNLPQQYDSASKMERTSNISNDSPKNSIQDRCLVSSNKIIIHISKCKIRQHFFNFGSTCTLAGKNYSIPQYLFGFCNRHRSGIVLLECWSNSNCVVVGIHIFNAARNQTPSGFWSCTWSLVVYICFDLSISFRRDAT
jgi:hypothetical protein